MWWVVAPLIASGLHCGTRPVPADARCLLVAPLIASGLHCGTDVPPVARYPTRRPAHRERAPLRRVAGVRLDEVVAVAPLIASGLHCGSTGRSAPARGARVAPLIASGLHCGTWTQSRSAG